MLLYEQALIDQILAGQLDLLRYEAGVRAQVLALLEKLRKDLAVKLAAEDLTYFSKARTAQLLREAAQVIDRYYAQAQGVMQTSLDAAAQAAAKQAAAALSEPLLAIQLAVGLPTQTFMERIVGNALIMGAPSAEWWTKQSADVAFKFASAVRQGIISGETNEQIVRRVVGTKTLPGIMTATRTNARALVHSSIQAVANNSRFETFRKNSDVVKGLRQHSTFDGHTTDICIAYSGQEWDIETLEPLPGSHLPFNGGPPRHWNCRSVLVPILKTFKELGVNVPEPEAGTRASSEGQIRADTTFEQFLSRRTEAQQDEQLGKGRAQLWRDKVITLEQLLDMTGNPMSLTQLEKKYGG